MEGACPLQRFPGAGATATNHRFAASPYLRTKASASSRRLCLCARRPSIVTSHPSHNAVVSFSLPGQSITRFPRADNDMYQHMNNSIYNFLYGSEPNTLVSLRRTS